MALTLRQVEEEKRYRYEERLGILCGDWQPTPQQEAMARREADSWERARMLARMRGNAPTGHRQLLQHTRNG